MSTIQSFTSVPVNASVLTEQSAAAAPNSTGCDGAAQSIDSLIFLVQKLNVDMRDMERQFASKMQTVIFDRQVAALQMKKEAIMKEFDASIVSAAAQIGSGMLGMLGAASGDELANGLAKGGGALEKGITDELTAGMTRDAKKSKLDGEVQDEFAKEFGRTMEQAVDRANEASRQLVQTTADLIALQDRIKQAVRF
jgi:secreted effector protein SseD